MRMIQFLKHAIHKRDFVSLGFFCAIASIFGWLLLLPFSRGIQRQTMERFHLQTPSFAVWAAQQPIPPMYNLENEAAFRLANPRQTPIGKTQATDDSSKQANAIKTTPVSSTHENSNEIPNKPKIRRRVEIEDKSFCEPITINHFPLRMVTFFDNRKNLFVGFREAELIVTSKYQGIEYRTCWKVTSDENDRLYLQQVEDRQ